MGFKRGFLIQSAMPPPPTPSILDKAFLDFDADEGIEVSGDDILSWTDRKSGIKLDQKTGNIKIGNKINEHSTVKFLAPDGADLRSSNISELGLKHNNFTVISVIFFDGANNNQYVQMLDQDGGLATILATETSIMQRIKVKRGNFYPDQWNNPQAPASNPFISTFMIDNANDISIYLNDKKGDVVKSSDSDIMDYSIADIAIGRNYMSGAISASVARVLFFNKTLTDIELGEAVQKLAEIYGISF